MYICMYVEADVEAEMCVANTKYVNLYDWLVCSARHSLLYGESECCTYVCTVCTNMRMYVVDVFQ